MKWIYRVHKYIKHFANIFLSNRFTSVVSAEALQIHPCFRRRNLFASPWGICPAEVRKNLERERTWKLRRIPLPRAIVETTMATGDWIKTLMTMKEDDGRYNGEPPTPSRVCICGNIYIREMSGWITSSGRYAETRRSWLVSVVKEYVKESVGDVFTPWPQRTLRERTR